METYVRKTLALLLCCFGLLFSPMALAEVPEATWDTLVGQSVLLTNPQGKEIRGTLLDAEGETLRIERPDGSVVTVGKAEVTTAKSLSESKPAASPSKEPEATPTDPAPPEVKALPTETTNNGPAKQTPAPDEPAPAEPTPTELPEVEPVAPLVNPDIVMQDAVAGEVDGRAAAQMESLVGPAAISAGVGVAGGACCCVGAGCAAIPVLIFGLKKVPPIDVGGSEAYNSSYNKAYASELKKRRWIWTGVGAGTGAAVGLGIYAVRLFVINPNTGFEPQF